MMQQVKALVAKADDLSSVSEKPHGGQRKMTPTVVPHMSHGIYAHKLNKQKRILVGVED